MSSLQLVTRASQCRCPARRPPTAPGVVLANAGVPPVAPGIFLSCAGVAPAAHSVVPQNAGVPPADSWVGFSCADFPRAGELSGVGVTSAASGVAPTQRRCFRKTCTVTFCRVFLWLTSTGPSSARRLWISSSMFRCSLRFPLSVLPIFSAFFGLTAVGISPGATVSPCKYFPFDVFLTLSRITLSRPGCACSPRSVLFRREWSHDGGHQRLARWQRVSRRIILAAQPPSTTASV